MAKKTTKPPTKTNTRKKATAKTTKTRVKKPVDAKPATTPEAPVTTVEVASEPQTTLKDVLMVYNSVMPSRRRWIKNRNALRNTWKELFTLLEQVSGRTGQKADLYDYNWHEVADKGGVVGLINKKAEDITIVSEGASDATLHAALADAQATIAELEKELAPYREQAAIKAETDGKAPEGEPIDLSGTTVTEEIVDEAKTAQEEDEAPQAEKTTTIATE